MKRELNPNLFGSAFGTPPTPSLGRSIGELNPSTSLEPGEFGEFAYELKELRGQTQNLEKRMDLEFSQNDAQLRMLNEHFAGLCESITNRITEIEGQLREYQTEKLDQDHVNQKIEDLIERHNQIVRNFENKMVHLTRVLSDQEMQILNSKAALEEAAQEISRLKK